MEYIAESVQATSLFCGFVFYLLARWDNSGGISKHLPFLPTLGGGVIIASVLGFFISTIILIWV